VDNHSSVVFGSDHASLVRPAQSSVVQAEEKQAGKHSREVVDWLCIRSLAWVQVLVRSFDIATDLLVVDMQDDLLHLMAWMDPALVVVVDCIANVVKAKDMIRKQKGRREKRVWWERRSLLEEVDSYIPALVLVHGKPWWLSYCPFRYKKRQK
jgi:hypothetical protein